MTNRGIDHGRPMAKQYVPVWGVVSECVRGFGCGIWMLLL